ncbi:MAG: DUF2752 domain-containing protein [Bacteroidales bacterium]|nr:DUF2752 domain-containing protein [Bacteroidales bacterium]
MPLSRNKLYIFLTVSCIVGYIWLFINYTILANNSTNEVGFCIIKHVTNIPCPSCGSTRSILSILKGNLSESLYWNPIGMILFLIIVITPLWIVFDYLFHKDSLLKFYKKSEKVLRQKKVAIPAIILILANWIWNIYKGL